MKVLVTGGAGFIGSNLVDRLLAEGHEVRVLDDLSTGFSHNVAAQADFIRGSVVDEAAVDRAVDGVEVVFHQAAARAVQRSVDRPLDTDTNNTHGTLTVLAGASRAGVRRVVAASSSSVYGGAAQMPTPEAAPTMPRSPYAVSKLAGEHYCRVYAELHGLETVSLRYFNVYGQRQRPDSAYAAVIPLFIEALLHGKPPTIHGDGEQSRDFTFIEDVVSCNLAAAVAPAAACCGQAYNVAGGRAYSLLELLTMLQALTDVRIDPVHTSPRLGDVRHTRADITRVRAGLGHEPSTSFAEGLRQTVDWFTTGVR